MSELQIRNVMTLQDTEEEVQIKSEPIDPEYETAVSPAVSTSSSQNQNQGVPSPSATTTDAVPNVNASQKIRYILNNMLDEKKELTIKSVIDDLLERNNYLLEQVDASIYKPQPRSMPNKKYDDILKQKIADQSAQKTPQLQSGQLLRPGSPTRTCSIPKADMPHISQTLMEMAALDSHAEEAFKAMKHEMVCGVAHKVYIMTQEGVNISTDLHFYWCNFCPYKAEKKSALLQHVMEHRFHCKTCTYQSFSRADVIRHACNEHEEFKETAKTLKYCTFLPDYLQVKINTKKRKHDDDATETPAKKSKENGTAEKKEGKRGADKDEDYVAFDMEVDEVDDDDDYSNAQQANETGESEKVLFPRNASKEIGVVGKPVETTSSTTGLRSDLSATGLRVLQPHSVQARPTPGNMQSSTTTRTGSTVTVSSGLCWNCGYCSFVTLSQTFLKSHLNTMHVGNAHKYVAMLVSSQEEMNLIKERDALLFSNTNPSLVYGNLVQAGTDKETTSTPTVEEPPTTEEDVATSVPSPRIEAQLEDSDDEDYIPDEEKRKYPLTYKCAHCNFNAPVCFKIKDHLQLKHNGCVLYALDMRAVKLKQRRYVFFCHRKNCSFTTKKTDEYLNHSDSCTPWMEEDCPEPIDPETKKCLELTRSFSSKISQKAFQMAKNFKSTKSAEYACVHCTYTSNNNTRVKKHVLSNHRDKENVMRDLQSHKMKKKTRVYFCRHCLWETRNEEELSTHLLEKHDNDTSVSSTGHYPIPTVSPKKETVVEETTTVSSTFSLPFSNASDNENGEEEEEDIQPEDLEVSEEEVQRLMNEYVKDEASRETSAGRPTRKASAEASVRVRAQGHQPPMFRCMQCSHMCFGVNLIRKHIRKAHKTEAFRAIDVKKKMSRHYAYFCICPKDGCKFVSISETAVISHAEEEHKMEREDEELQRMLKPFSGDSASSHQVAISQSNRHSGSGHSGAFECLYCTTSVIKSDVADMKEHIIIEHPGEEIIFRDCVARRLRKSSRVFMCPEHQCLYTSPEQKDYELHKLAHNQAHIFECALCQWFTTVPLSVSTHMSAVHPGQNVTTIEIFLDLDEDGQVVKKVGGTIIKQEPDF